MDTNDEPKLQTTQRRMSLKCNAYLYHCSEPYVLSRNVYFLRSHMGGVFGVNTDPYDLDKSNLKVSHGSPRTYEELVLRYFEIKE
jgi:hypothetical protein